MARITVEDCLNNVENRFELVLVSSKRARQLMNGTKKANLDWENDKATVVALREIEEGFVNASILEEESHDDYFEDISTEQTETSGQDLELAALMSGMMDTPAAQEEQVTETAEEHTEVEGSE